MKKIISTINKVITNGFNLEPNEEMTGFGVNIHGKLFVRVHDLSDNSLGISGMLPYQKDNLWVVWFDTISEAEQWLKCVCQHHFKAQ